MALTKSLPIAAKNRPVILAIFSHPDDEAFLAGGTLASYARQGAQVELLCLTNGENGMNSVAAETSGPVSSLRRTELESCCKTLGVNLLEVLDFPDSGLQKIKPVLLASAIARFLARRKPDIVITFGPDGMTGHPDHIATSRAATLAFDWASSFLPTSRLLYAGLSEQTVAGLSNRLEGRLDDATPLRLTGVPETELTIRVDIRQTAPIKWAALNCHRSQADNFKDLSAQDRLLLSQYEYFRVVRTARAN